MDKEHITVLLNEAIEALEIKADGCYLDATFGRGGHSKLILQNLSSAGKLYALDRDPQAAATATTIQDKRFHFIKSEFSRLDEVIPADVMFDGILFDFGVSSPQLDQAERGFSFSKAGPLDMRMDNSSGITAQDWLNSVDERELLNSIRDLGGENHQIAKRIARAIKEALPRIENTLDLANVISQAVPKKFHRYGYHPATQTFQAIRMSVNNEVLEIKNSLTQSFKRLKSAGLLVAISFHQGEDALVKQFIRAHEGNKIPSEIPIEKIRNEALLRQFGKIIRPSEAEISRNPRSRSAVLRRAIKQ